MAEHVAKSYEHLQGKLQGISNPQLAAHLTLYQGYVKKLNEIWEKLPRTDRALVNYSFGDYSELRRREPVAYNGTVLHELYFDGLGPDGQPSPELKKAIETAFGSYDAWVQDFKACGASAHGWVLLGWDPLRNQLANNLIHGEHHVGLFAGYQPILALDVWEHAYFLDYQTKKGDYLSAYFKNLNWKTINERYARGAAAAHAASR